MHTDEFVKAVVSRRRVVAASLAPLVVPRHVLGGPGYQAPSDTLTVAAVGIGGMGRNYLDGCKAEKIVALCDLDHNYAAKVFDAYPAAPSALAGGLLLPVSKFKDFEQPPKTLPRCERPDHYTDWTRSCKNGVPTALPVEFACQLTEVALLGTLALRAEKVIEWESASMRVTNAPEANRFVDPPYRAGWRL